MRVMVMALGILLLFGCARETGVSPSLNPTANPSGLNSAGSLLVAESHKGGLCPEGECVSRVEVDMAGNWVFKMNGVLSGSGLLSNAELGDLQKAVENTQLREGEAFKGVCPTAFDGQKTIIEWMVGGRIMQADSCVTVLNREDPLVIALKAAHGDGLP